MGAFRHIGIVLLHHHRDRWGWLWNAIAAMLASLPKGVAAMVEAFTYSNLSWLLWTLLIAVAFAFVRSSWALSQRLVPALRIVFDESGSDHMPLPLGYPGTNVIGFRVGLYNDSDGLMRNCRAEMFDVVLADGTRTEHRFPKALEYQLAPGSIDQIPIDVQSTRTIFANVVSLDHGDQDSGILLRCSSPLMPIFIDRRVGCYINIRVQTDGGRGDSKWFYVYVSCCGELRFQPSDGPMP